MRLAAFTSQKGRIQSSTAAAMLGVCLLPTLVRAQPAPSAPQPTSPASPESALSAAPLPPSTSVAPGAAPSDSRLQGAPTETGEMPGSLVSQRPPAPRPGVQEAYPIVRLASGQAMHLSSNRGAIWGFHIDLALGVGLRFRALESEVDQTPDLAFDLGYTFDSAPRLGGHFFTVGPTPFFRPERWVAFGLAPRLVVGETFQGKAIGVRTSIVLAAMVDLFQIEVSHQWLTLTGDTLLPPDAREQHDVRTTASIDIARTVLIRLFAAKNRPPR